MVLVDLNALTGFEVQLQTDYELVEEKPLHLLQFFNFLTEI